MHGLFVVPELAARLTHRPSGMPSHLGVDAIFLAMALPYVLGTVMAWPELSRRAWPKTAVGQRPRFTGETYSAQPSLHVRQPVTPVALGPAAATASPAP